MGRRIENGIPQVEALVTLSKSGKVSLKRSVKDYLNSKTGPFFATLDDEVLLTTERAGVPVLYAANRITLPDEILEYLALQAGDLLAMIAREDGVALKKTLVEERPGEYAHAMDFETPTTLTRVAFSNPMPDQLISKLKQDYGQLTPKANVRDYLSGRQSLDAWRARQHLGCPDKSDVNLVEELIEARFATQQENGSWEDDVLITARNLRELAQLGITREDPRIKDAAEWVFARASSPWNPGMFFSSDALVAEQIRIVEERQKGNRLRFRQIKKGEQNRVIAGDTMIDKPCGPRIMWPNALVTEALLMLGYEVHPRMQETISFMREHEWCECGYQNGTSSWRQNDPLEAADYVAYEQGCIHQYQMGGMRGLDILKVMCQAEATFNTWYRESLVTSGDEKAYYLRMPDHIQGCEFITTRAMRRVQDPFMKQYADAHIWRFAGIQRLDGRFPPDSYGTGFGLVGNLHFMVGDGLKRLHPAAEVAVWRALPVLLDMQNDDGSWGDEPRKDAMTYAVVNCLEAVGYEV